MMFLYFKGFKVVYIHYFSFTTCYHHRNNLHRHFSSSLLCLPCLSPSKNSSSGRVPKDYFHEVVQDCRNRNTKKILFNISILKNLFLSNSVININDQEVAKATAGVAKVLHRRKNQGKKSLN